MASVPVVYALAVSYVEFDGVTDDDEWVRFDGVPGGCWTRGPVPPNFAGAIIKVSDTYARWLAESLDETKEG